MMGDIEQTSALPDQQLILRAICDPGSFTKRGDYHGEPYGESIQHWSMRAVMQVIGEWLAGRTVLELPEPAVTNERGAAWTVTVDNNETDFAAFLHPDDNSPVVESDFAVWDPAELRSFCLAGIAASDHALRLASESSGDGEPDGTAD